MNCPNCEAQVADGDAVCPACDQVLDASLFDNEPPPDDAPPARAASKVKTTGKPATRPGGVKKVVKKGVKKAPRLPEPTAPKPKEADWRSAISQEDWDQGQPKVEKVVEAPQPKALDADDMLKDWKTFFLELSIPDKVAFFGFLGMLFCCILPWRETVHEGEVLGVMTSGILVAMLDLVAIASIVVRVRKVMEHVNPVLIWSTQLGALGLALVWCVVFVIGAWDSTQARSPIGNGTMMVSKPAFGVVMAFIAGGVSGLGTVLGLKELKL